MTKQVFKVGNRVVLLTRKFGMAEWSGIPDFSIVPGSVGTVVGVRPCDNPKGPQGPWLYDVEFPVSVMLPEGYVTDEEAAAKGWKPGQEVSDVCWLIFDAEDIHQLGLGEAVQ
jgi:hypothetical protein